MGIPPEQAETAAWLRDMAANDPVETHISLVFRGRDTAWKLKKAVRLPFLDFSTVAARRHFAERELALNAPAAPGLYRDVVPVMRRADGGLEFGDPDARGAIDWVLRMALLAPEDLLDARAAAGALDPALQDALADAIAAYHARCPVAAIDAVAAMRAVVAGNVESARAAGLPAAAVDRWAERICALLAATAPVQMTRAATGFVRRGHGDLHLGNLCLWQGRPVPFDALEFDERLATIDVAYDLAFLLMDLDRRVDRAAANRVMNRYVARTGDGGLTGLLAPFLSLRAMILAHVRASRGDGVAATAYLDAADAYLWPSPAVVVAIGGLQGTGKSTLARALAPELGPAPGALVLRSDEIRKRRHGVAPEERLPPSAYTEAESEAVFAALAGAVAEAAGGGHAVIADATFIDPAHRRAVETAARDAGVRFVGLWLEAKLPVLEARLAARRGDASDATVAVLRAAARAPTFPPRDWCRIDATDRGVALAAARKEIARGQ